jgi:PHP family Zn ribbon phosphoesterase
MTPNNILNMAMLKDLDFVSITDHNSAKQLNVIDEIETAYDFIFIPGIEVTVKENFDVLCYFRTYNDAYRLSDIIANNLHSDWGPFSEKDQIITDIYDIPKDTFPKPLLSKTIPYLTLYKHVKELNGAVVLAHIDRKNKSALHSFHLDTIPFDGIEVQQFNKEKYLKAHPELQKYKLFASSDSHSLLTISERVESIELREKSIDAFFDYLVGENHE